MIDPGRWTARVRLATLGLSDPVEYTSLTLVEDYGPADMLMVTGRLADLQPALYPDRGIVVYDSTGECRFSGVPGPGPEAFERHGDGTGSIIYVADTVQMWWRICYPVPVNDWTTAGQNATYDTQTGSVEDRIVGYVTRNLGPSARTERRLTPLHMPTSAHRGASATSRVRFQILGQLVADLADSANLRVRILHNDGGWLDLVIDDAPDYSAWARFGDAAYGGPGILSEDWGYKLGPPTGTTVLCAAGGEGKDRNLGKSTDSASESLWSRRVESFLDQRGTGDLPDANASLAEAQKDLTAKTQIKNLASSALKLAVDHLAKHPGDTNAQDAKDTAQDTYDEALSDYNDAVTAVADATSARDAAATSDAAAIAQAMSEALIDLVGSSDVSAPVAGLGYDFGTELPVGAKCTAELDGELITERLRQITTTIAVADGEPTVKVDAVFGSPDAALQSPTQRKLADMLKRVSYLERS